MNKCKGFTLAELLGVIIVLGVIALITFPIVNNTIKNNKEKLYNSQLEEIKLAAEKWAYSNLNMLPVNENESITVTLLELKKAGYVAIDSRNPKTGELLPNDMVVTITLKNNNYDIYVDGNSGTDLSNEFNENAPTIVLNGNYIDYVEINSSYEEKGAKAVAKDGSEVEVNITYQENGSEIGNIDVTKFSTYTVIYSATINGYTSIITRTVVVRDTTPPNLIIPETTQLTEKQLTTFDLLAGVSVMDNSGENIKIETRGFDRLPTDKIIEYKACDSNNNCTIKRRIIKFIETDSYVDNSGANKPELLNNMVPVKYINNNWVVADISEKWYDYDAKEWANAVVLNTTKNVGEVVNESDIDLWYVWIPRYKYQLFNANNESVNEQEIQIQFESGTNTTGIVSCVDAVSGSGDTSEICTNAVNGNWYTHPAFTFGNEELKGFWVGKFEVSGSTDKIMIKPNVISLRNETVSSFFTAIQNMKSFYNLNGDTHMMKNMEWGAVAYLSHSKYGLIAQLYSNNSSEYYTGRSGGNVGGSTNTVAIQYPGNSTSSNKYYNYGYYTYDGKIVNYDGSIGSYASDRTLGTKASTTGNIYGVYDMSGGAWDYVMGAMVDNSGKFYLNESGFSSVPNSKYYNSYTYGTNSTNFNRGKLGDATKETIKTLNTVTGGWYDVYSVFPYSSNYFSSRGAYYGDTNLTGIFDFFVGSGGIYSTASSRAVLCK